MKILLAIDPSPASEVALNALVARRHASDTSVEVLSVIAPKYLRGAQEVVMELQSREERLVDRAAERLRSSGLDAVSLIMSGDPKEIIIDRAGVIGADFVILGAHGETALPRFLLGSVARAVARFSPCSVGVMRASPKRTSDDTAMRILLATDGSQSSLVAARSIGTRLWPTHTVVRIVAVVDWPYAETPPPGISVDQSLRSESDREAQEALLDAHRVLVKRGFETLETAPLLYGSPKEAILDEASRWRADLIVVGSHGGSGGKRLQLGSVSEAVAMHAECSVEVIRSQLD